MDRLLSPDELESYIKQGFACVDRPLFSHADLEDVRRALDRLFSRYERIPLGFAQDLDLEAEPGHGPRIPEINFTTVLAPRLLRSPIVKTCTAIARQLHGPHAHLVFDHAIYKPPLNGAPTAWHQDAAYAKEGEQAVGFWVPLQSVDRSAGCMRFIPGSHLQGLSRHEHLSSGTNPRLRVARPGEEAVVDAPVSQGGVVVHNVFTLHSTGANERDAPRRVWVLNFGTGPADPALGRALRSARVRAGIALRNRPR